jgi:hypothetical protein
MKRTIAMATLMVVAACMPGCVGNADRAESVSGSAEGLQSRGKATGGATGTGVRTGGTGQGGSAGRSGSAGTGGRAGSAGTGGSGGSGGWASGTRDGSVSLALILILSLDLEMSDRAGARFNLRNATPLQGQG